MLNTAQRLAVILKGFHQPMTDVLTTRSSPQRCAAR
jgi:hypothetical protein